MLIGNCFVVSTVVDSSNDGVLVGRKMKSTYLKLSRKGVSLQPACSVDRGASF